MKYTRGFIAVCLAALALVLAAYSNTIHNSFHFDDFGIVVDNIFIRDLANIPRYFADARTFCSTPANATYRPLVLLTLAIDYRLGGGLDPYRFHVTQITLLIATGAMLFLLYARLFAGAGLERARLWAALFAATLFCVHPANTQAMNYITVRSELLSGLGVLGAFIAYIYLPRWRRWHLYLVPVIVGSCAKTPAVMFAPLFFFYVLLIEEDPPASGWLSAEGWARVKRSLIAAAPAFALSAALFFLIEGKNSAAYKAGISQATIGRAQYLLTQTWVWVRYIRLFIFPTGLTADTDLQPLASVLDPKAIAGILVLLSSLAVIWRTSLRRELRPVAFGIAWFWIALLPASSIFPLAEMTNDHRMFFPFMGLTAAAVCWVCLAASSSELPAGSRRSGGIAAAAAVLILGVCSIATYRRNRAWLSEETLWRDVIAKSPGNPRGLMNYGLTQMSMGRYSEAKDCFARAYDISPNYPALSINMAIVLDALGDKPKAAEWFQRALTLAPNDAPAHRFFGNWLMQQGRAPEALVHLEKASDLSLADMDVRHSLLDLYAASGDARLRPLIRQVLEVSGADPVALAYSRTPSPGASAQWFQRGLAHTNANEHAQAAFSYRAALSIDSANPDSWNNLGWTLGKLGFIAEAVSALEHAVALRPDFALAKNNLAGMRSALEPARFNLAVELQRSGRDAEAILIYRRLVAANSAWTSAHYNMGYALLTAGQCPDAVSEFNKTLALDPKFALAHLHLSECLQRMGRQHDAARHRALYESSASIAARGSGSAK